MRETQAHADALAFLRWLYGDDAPGWLTISTFDAQPTQWFQASQLEQVATYCQAIARRYNVYFGLGLRHEQLADGRGESTDVLGIPGLWVELDIQHAVHSRVNLPETIEDALALVQKALPLAPSLTIRSGYGIHVYWLFRELWVFDDEKDRQAAYHLLHRLQATVKGCAELHGCDVDSTFDLARVLRIPGTYNRKIADDPRPVEIIEANPDQRYNPSDFDQYLIDVKETNHQQTTSDAYAGDLAPIDAIALKIPNWLKLFIYSGKDPDYTPGDTTRSAAEFKVMQRLIEHGIDDPTILSIMLDERYGISQKPREAGRAWLTKDLARAHAKLNGHRSRPEPEEAEHSPEAHQGPSHSLADIIQKYEAHYYLPDPGILEVNLAAIVANQFSGDPVWIQNVGPSSGGKTEPLLICRRVPKLRIVSTLTEAGLLSGTSAKERTKESRGGLLREIGKFGIVICKDFTSVLAIRHETRAQVLAAMRDIYDGHYTRNLGTDGGKTLTWEGKIGFLAACTEAIDSHHAVLAAMGHRFLFYRLPPIDQKGQANAAIDAAGTEVKTRDDLADMIQGFFAQLSIPETLPTIRQESKDFLVMLAIFAARCRSAVDRDGYRREIELIHEGEAPARFVKSLRYLYAGLSIIGVSELRTKALLAKIALDSIPKIRRLLLQELIKHDIETPTPKLGDAIGYPTETTRRGLEDLAAHHVVSRSEWKGHVHAWRLNDEFRKSFTDISSVLPKSTESYIGHETS
jgi:hypothetical protein